MGGFIFSERCGWKLCEGEESDGLAARVSLEFCESKAEKRDQEGYDLSLNE